MRVHSCSDLGNCPTSPCELDVVLWLELPGPGVCPDPIFPMSIGASPVVLFLMKARTLSSKLSGSTLSTSTCVSIALRLVSETTLMYAALTMALGISSLETVEQIL